MLIENDDSLLVIIYKSLHSKNLLNHLIKQEYDPALTSLFPTLYPFLLNECFVLGLVDCDSLSKL